MLERISLSLSLVLFATWQSTPPSHTSSPHPATVQEVSLKTQKNRNSVQRREKLKTRQKKKKRKGDTQEVREWERVSEREIEEIDEVKERGMTGGDGKWWRGWKQTLTHTLTHTSKRKTADLTFWPKNVKIAYDRRPSASSKLLQNLCDHSFPSTLNCLTGTCQH